MMRGGGVSHAPRVCMLPDELTSRALQHMTGYPTVQHKLTCARTMGLHQVTGLGVGLDPKPKPKPKPDALTLSPNPKP